MEHGQMLLSVDERGWRSTDAPPGPRMSIPSNPPIPSCGKGRSRAVIKSASASGLSLMIPSGIVGVCGTSYIYEIMHLIYDF